MEGVLRQARPHESDGGVAGVAQYPAVRQPDRARGAAEECAMREAHERPQGGRLARPQLENELRLVTDVGELIGEQCAAEGPQPLAAGRGFERAVIHVADQLGRDEHVQIELETGQPAHAAEHGIGPMPALGADAVLVHEIAQQASMSLLLADEELDDARQELIAMSGGKTASRPQKSAAIGRLAKLEYGDRAGNEPALLRPQAASPPAGQRPRLLCVVFEMIEPNSEIREHGNVRRRAWRECPAQPGGRRGAIVANSGGGTGSAVYSFTTYGICLRRDV